MRDVKYVTYKHLTIGKQISDWKEGRSTHFATAVVKDINPAYVTLLVFGEREERVNSETGLFGIEISEAEYREKYRAKAIQIVQSLSNRLRASEIGYHEMANGWVSYDPFEMAQYCTRENYAVLGICEDVKCTLYGQVCVGICAENEFGERFWCHASEVALKKMADLTQF